LAHYNAKPLLVVLQPSYRLAALITFAALSSAWIALAISLDWWIKLIACLTIAAAAIYHVQHALLRFDSSWASIVVNSAGEVSLRRQDGRENSNVKVLPSSFVASFLTILHIKADSNRMTQYLLLLPDSANEQSLRQLRVWLLWGWNTQEKAS